MTTSHPAPRYLLVHAAGRDGHHFFRDDDGALIIADHSGDDGHGRPTSPDACDDGALVVVRGCGRADSAVGSWHVEVRLPDGSMGYVPCDARTHDLALVLLRDSTPNR